jgi:hypothetical protein
MATRDWKLIEKDFRVSGQTLTAYCQEKGIPYSSARKHIDVVPAADKRASRPRAKKTTWHHDWTALKQEFMTYEGTLSDFARAKGFQPNEGNFGKNTKGWPEERATLQLRTVQEAKKQAALQHRERYEKHLTELREMAESSISHLQQLDKEVLTMERESTRDIKDIMTTLKIKAELVEKTRSLLVDFLPLPIAEDSLEANLKRALSHYQELGDRTAYLQILKLLGGIKTAESGFDWSLFDEKISQ